MDEGVAELVARMENDLAQLSAARDTRRFFHATYLRTTRAVVDEMAKGTFADPAWLERLDLAFADLYLAALDADRRGEPVVRPWRVAFDAARDLSAVHHVLLGINAHINYDLPQALLTVISPVEFDDPGLLASREADHRRIDQLLTARVGAEDVAISAESTTTMIDRLMRPANRAATRRILTEARAKVWTNTAILDRARRAGPDRYVRVLADLEKLCAERLVDLTAPGPVLLRLALRGFGVVLPDDGRSGELHSRRW